MRLYTGVLLLLIALAARGYHAYRPPYMRVEHPDVSRPECICIQVWEPVCGANGVTYGNPCLLRCSGVWQQCEGPCPCSGHYVLPMPVYPMYPVPMYPYQPVMMAPGHVPSVDCLCPPIKDPVCAVTGETYDNACEAHCDGKAVACESKCPCT